MHLKGLSEEKASFSWDPGFWEEVGQAVSWGSLGKHLVIRFCSCSRALEGLQKSCWADSQGDGDFDVDAASGGALGRPSAWV